VNVLETVVVVEIALEIEALILNVILVCSFPTRGMSASNPISIPTSKPIDIVKVDCSDAAYATDSEVCVSVLPPAKETKGKQKELKNTILIKRK